MAAIKGRKDSKGYVLRTGETQRNDGRYCFAYTDKNRKRHYIYAQTLPDLRAREKSLQLKYDQGVDAYSAGKLTVNDVYDRYISQKYNLKTTTKTEWPTAKNTRRRGGGLDPAFSSLLKETPEKAGPSQELTNKTEKARASPVRAKE